jgi:hypothetical protein
MPKKRSKQPRIDNGNDRRRQKDVIVQDTEEEDNGKRVVFACSSAVLM